MPTLDLPSTDWTWLAPILVLWAVWSFVVYALCQAAKGDPLNDRAHMQEITDADSQWAAEYGIALLPSRRQYRRPGRPVNRTGHLNDDGGPLERPAA